MPTLDIPFNVDLYVKAFATVTVLMDPVGTTPVFLALTKRLDEPAKRRAAWQATAAAAAVILTFGLFGELILRGLGIGLPALKAAGGLLLVLVALELLQPFDETSAPASDGVNIALVPLGTPLLAGPGAIATTMMYVRQGDDGGTILSVLLAVLSSLVLVYVSLRFAGQLAALLGRNGVDVMSRVMGLLAAAIAVQLLASAVEQWVREGVAT